MLHRTVRSTTITTAAAACLGASLSCGGHSAALPGAPTVAPPAFPEIPISGAAVPGMASYEQTIPAFNARATTGNFDGELDAALWGALAQVTSFPAHDLFSAFP
jgi:hypothetical protein